MNYMELMGMKKTCIECKERKEKMAFKGCQEICRACWLILPKEKREDYLGRYSAEIKIAKSMKSKATSLRLRLAKQG